MAKYIVKYQLLGCRREMENIRRCPTFGDCVTILTETSMQYKYSTVQEYRLHLSPLLLNVMYCVRVSLWTVKIFLAQH